MKNVYNDEREREAKRQHPFLAVFLSNILNI